MGATRKLAIGLSLAGGALFTAWMLKGDRVRKTRDFLVRKAQGIKQAAKKGDVDLPDEPGVHYI